MDKLINMKPGQQWALILGITVAILAAFYMLAVRSVTAQVGLLRQDLEAKRQEVTRLRRIEANLREFEQEIKLLEQRLKVALTLLPEKKEIPSILKQVSMLGAETGLQFAVFQPLPERKMEFYAEVPVQLQLGGGYHDFAAFFDRISNLDRIITVSEIQITLPQAGVGGGVLSMSCLATTYRFLTSEEMGQ